MFAFPYATYGRSFGGTATLLAFPGRVVDVSGFAPPNLPAAPLALALGWASLAALILSAALGASRSRWLWAAGLLTLILGTLAVVAFEGVLSAAARELAVQGTPARRIPYRLGGFNLGMFTVIASGLVSLIAGASAYPVWYGRLNRLRGLLVPLVAIGLAIVVGAAVVLIIQPVPVQGPLTGAVAWYGKLDLVWFVYSTLFAPLTNLGDFFQSLTLATPLIFTGLAVAFAFRAGLFNIGAPGQLAIGAVFAMLVGVYLPLPGVVLLPLTVAAAALGGALWGAIPGWLRARFGASEVINTIMLNYIASSLFIFLIGSNTFPFFGREYSLPFKAPGFEAKSYELRPGARLPSAPDLLGLKTGDQGFLTLAPVLALVVFGALYFALARHRRRLLISLGAGLLTLVASWSWFGVTVQATGNVASSRLNLSFVIALASAVLFALYMWRTSGGYALRAVGFSPKAAEYGGISVAKNTVLAMTIAGAFAGLAATHYVMGGALDEYRLKQNLPYNNVGFDGITVALMGQSTPVGVVAASVLFGTLDTGGLYVSQQLDKVDKDIVTVLKALIVLFIAAGGFLSRRLTDPPPAVLTPNVAESILESRQALGQVPENSSENVGAGGNQVPAASPLNDGRRD